MGVRDTTDTLGASEALASFGSRVDLCAFDAHGAYGASTLPVRVSAAYAAHLARDPDGTLNVYPHASVASDAGGAGGLPSGTTAVLRSSARVVPETFTPHWFGAVMGVRLGRGTVGDERAYIEKFDELATTLDTHEHGEHARLAHAGTDMDGARGAGAYTALDYHDAAPWHATLGAHARVELRQQDMGNDARDFSLWLVNPSSDAVGADLQQWIGERAAADADFTLDDLANSTHYARALSMAQRNNARVLARVVEHLGAIERVPHAEDMYAVVADKNEPTPLVVLPDFVNFTNVLETRRWHAPSPVYAYMNGTVSSLKGTNTRGGVALAGRPIDDLLVYGFAHTARGIANAACSTFALFPRRRAAGTRALDDAERRYARARVTWRGKAASVDANADADADTAVLEKLANAYVSLDERRTHELAINAEALNAPADFHRYRLVAALVPAA